MEIPEPWRRWVFAELLPWARGNAEARDATADDCDKLLEAVVAGH